MLTDDIFAYLSNFLQIFFFFPCYKFLPVLWDQFQINEFVEKEYNSFRNSHSSLIKDIENVISKILIKNNVGNILIANLAYLLCRSHSSMTRLILDLAPPPIRHILPSIDATPNPCLAGGIAASMVLVLVIGLNRIYTQVSMI
jgi:hypothetical protein